MITLRCPQCNHRLKVPQQATAYKAKCPYCSTKFVIPAEMSEGAVEAAILPTALEKVKVADKPTVTRQSGGHDTGDHEAQADMPFSRPTLSVDPEELIDMTAMVDIVFFLLIFFLVTSMAAVHSSARMPRPEGDDEKVGAAATASENPQNDSNAVIVTIKKDDTIEIDGVAYRDLGDLIVRLRQLRNVGGSETSMLIMGHGDASHGVAVSVLDAGYEVGIDRLRLSVVGESSE